MPIERLRSIGIAIALAAAFHWPLLLSDSVLWDDVTLVHAVESGDADLLVKQFTDAGAPQWGWMHVGLGQLPHAARWYKAAALVCLLGATACLVSILSRDERLESGDVRLIAVLAAASPIYSQWQGLITLPYATCYFLFFAGSALYRRDVATGSAFGRFGVAAMPLLALSFTIESLGVFFFGAMAYFWWIDGRPHAPREAFITRSVMSTLRFPLRHSPALLLPIAVYFGKRILFPMREAYAGYNRVEITLGRVAEGFEDFAKRLICDPFEDLVKFAASEPLVFAALLIPGIVLGGLCAWRLKAWPSPDIGRRSRGMLLAAGVLFVCGAFPYVAVGKAPSINSYESRHALLMGLPLALGCYAVLRATLRNPIILRAALAGVFAACFVLQTKTYVLWQNRYTKSLAIAANLEDSAASLGNVVVLDDRAEFGMAENWRPYEIHAMLKQACKDELRMGCDARRYPADLEKLRGDATMRRYFACRDAVETDKPTRVIALHATALSDAVIFFRYLTVSDRAAFVKSLVRLEIAEETAVTALPSPARR